MSFQKIETDNTQRPEGIPKVLVFGYKDSEAVSIKELVQMLPEVGILYIEEDMLGLTIGNILDELPERVGMKIPMKPKVVLFNGLSENEVHILIEGIKKLSDTKPIFAMVTETSKKWKFGNLIKELVEEHMMMSKHHKK